MQRCSKAVGFAACLYLAVPAAAAFASMSFGEPQMLNEPATGYPSKNLATDGNGTWILVRDVDDGPTDGPAFSRSADDGQTWSGPVLLTDNQQTGGPVIATDGNGTWIAMWFGVQSGFVAVSSRSTDNGATWGLPVVVGDGIPQGIAYDTSGTWLAVFFGDGEFFASRSIDGGQIWSTAIPITDDASIGRRSDGDARFATDNAGTVVLCWPGEDFDDIRVSRSADVGLSWEPTVVLSDIDVPGFSTNEASCDVATDGAGHWSVVWQYYTAVWTISTLRFSASADDALSWSASATLHPYLESSTGAYAGFPRIAYDDAGNFQTVWQGIDSLHGTIGKEGDILTSYSRDGGLSWSSPAALVTQARNDEGHLDSYPALATSPQGRTLVVWTDAQEVVPEPLGAVLSAASERNCPLVARNDCLLSTRSKGSTLKIKDPVGGDDQLSWKWSSGQETSGLDLGDPTTTDDYVVCLYEPGLIGEWDVPAGGSCSNMPCWSKQDDRVIYRDAKVVRGSVSALRIRAGAEGESLLRVTASGPALAPPRLPLLTPAPLKIQLLNLGTSTCWEGIHHHASRNDTRSFVSASD